MQKGNFFDVSDYSQLYEITPREKIPWRTADSPAVIVYSY